MENHQVVYDLIGKLADGVDKNEVFDRLKLLKVDQIDEKHIRQMMDDLTIPPSRYLNMLYLYHVIHGNFYGIQLCLSDIIAIFEVVEHLDSDSVLLDRSDDTDTKSGLKLMRSLARLRQLRNFTDQLLTSSVNVKKEYQTRSNDLIKSWIMFYTESDSFDTTNKTELDEDYSTFPSLGCDENVNSSGTDLEVSTNIENPYQYTIIDDTESPESHPSCMNIWWFAAQQVFKQSNALPFMGAELLMSLPRSIRYRLQGYQTVSSENDEISNLRLE
ncbi:uncharacterized protein V1516DRAFT_680991 [Lipomyces oligophaga]|uniref:uncharacterized protein n=1 Tax=Lipomyces oligophaga TaxID=45792 RepID=UPI0034CEB777